MSVLATFLDNCHDAIAWQARAMLVERQCPFILAAMLPPPPTLLKNKVGKCSIMLAPLNVCDTKGILKMLFEMPRGTVMGVYR
jgi:hypothetical protein